MNDQFPPQSKGLWDRKTYASAFVSAVLATAVALTVCAFKGETVALDHVPSVRVSQSHTEPLGSHNAV